MCGDPCSYVYLYIYTIKYVEIRSTLNIYHQVFHHAIGGNSWKFIRYRISAVRKMGWRCQWLVQWSPAWTAWNFSHVVIPKITNKIGLYEPSPNGRCMMVYCWFAHITNKSNTKNNGRKWCRGDLVTIFLCYLHCRVSSLINIKNCYVGTTCLRHCHTSIYGMGSFVTQTLNGWNKATYQKSKNHSLYIYVCKFIYIFISYLTWSSKYTQMNTKIFVIFANEPVA